eukprot:scaffold620_cov386-Prasinococcus_capsulatus_cf.AAC.5
MPSSRARCSLSAGAPMMFRISQEAFSPSTGRLLNSLPTDTSSVLARRKRRPSCELATRISSEICFSLSTTACMRLSSGRHRYDPASAKQLLLEGLHGDTIHTIYAPVHVERQVGVAPRARRLPRSLTAHKLDRHLAALTRQYSTYGLESAHNVGDLKLEGDAVVRPTLYLVVLEDGLLLETGAGVDAVQIEEVLTQSYVRRGQVEVSLLVHLLQRREEIAQQQLIPAHTQARLELHMEAAASDQKDRSNQVRRPLPAPRTPRTGGGRLPATPWHGEQVRPTTLRSCRAEARSSYSRSSQPTLRGWFECDCCTCSRLSTFPTAVTGTAPSTAAAPSPHAASGLRGADEAFPLRRCWREDRQPEDARAGVAAAAAAASPAAPACAVSGARARARGRSRMYIAAAGPARYAPVPARPMRPGGQIHRGIAPPSSGGR